MKNKMIKVLCASMALVLAIISSNSLHLKASDAEVTYEEQISYLHSIGTPDDLLAEYTRERIGQLYDNLRNNSEGN